jgi:hypothetical protein
MTDPQTVPWNGFPYPPRIALLLFVHHVRGVPPGLYLLGRDEARLAALRQAMRNSFQWKTAHDYLPLHLLAPGDFRRQAQGLAFDQEIVGDGVFSVAMIADFAATLEIEGAWAYRRLHWEAGLLGQVLYLEAEAAGLGATGIGAPVADPRLSTLPAYHNLAAERASL